MNKRWTHSNKSIYNLGYHFIWCPKYRRDILIDDVEKRLKELLIEKSLMMNIKIEKLTIMPNHIHLFIKAEPIDSPHWIVQQLKGYTSNILRKEFKHLTTKLPTLWTRSYYCESVGNISEKTILKYIEEQKNK